MLFVTIEVARKKKSYKFFVETVLIERNAKVLAVKLKYYY